LTFRTISSPWVAAGLLLLSRGRALTGPGAWRRVDIVPGKTLIRVLPAALESFARGPARNETVATVADEVGAFGLAESLADLEVVFGLEKLHECPLQLAVAELPRDMHGLFREGIDSRVVHGRRDIEGRRNKILNLVRPV